MFHDTVIFILYNQNLAGLNKYKHFSMLFLLKYAHVPELAAFISPLTERNATYGTETQTQNTCL